MKSGGQSDESNQLVVRPKSPPVTATAAPVAASSPPPSPSVSQPLSLPAAVPPPESPGARVSGGGAFYDSVESSSHSPAFASALAEYMRLKPSSFGEQQLAVPAVAAQQQQVSGPAVANRRDREKHSAVEKAATSGQEQCPEEFKPTIWYMCTSPTSNRTDTAVSLDCLAVGK